MHHYFKCADVAALSDGTELVALVYKNGATTSRDMVYRDRARHQRMGERAAAASI